jgi:hypothetical protein
VNKQRKETIVQEIKYWKHNRMLPEQYCDFLLALYTEGEGSNSPLRKQKRSLLTMLFACLIPLMIPITFLVIYFTEMPVDLQMLLITFFIIISLFGYFVFRKEYFFVHIPIIVTALLTFILSVKLLELVSFELAVTFTVITVQAIGWFIIGYLKRWYYLNAAAIVSMLLLALNIILM